MTHSTSFITRTHCPSCSSQEFTSIYRVSFADGEISAYISNAYGQSNKFDHKYLENVEYSLLRCHSCELVFQEYIPGPELMYELYEHWINAERSRSIQANLHADHYSLHSQDVLQILTFLNKPPSSVKILDFGLGWGAWASMAKAFGCKVYGVELSKKRIEHAKAKGIEILEWKDISQHKFDFVNIDQVFEHVADPIEILTQLNQSLSSEGLLKISVPNSFGIKYRLHKMDWGARKGSLKSLNPVAPLEHINCFSRESMHRLAQRADLFEVKLPMNIQYRYTTAWDSPKRSLRNLLLPIYRNVFGLQNYYLFKNSAS